MVGLAGVDWGRADSEKVILIRNLERSAIEWREQTDVGVLRLASLSLGELPPSLPHTHGQMSHPPGSALLHPLPPPFPGSLPQSFSLQEALFYP